MLVNVNGAARTGDEEDRKFVLRKAKDWTKLAQEKELASGHPLGQRHSRPLKLNKTSVYSLTRSPYFEEPNEAL